MWGINHRFSRRQTCVHAHVAEYLVEGSPTQRLHALTKARTIIWVCIGLDREDLLTKGSLLMLERRLVAKGLVEAGQ
eukprot:CAMPEP_0115882026 /NCGR_PEP_ID=MMETSP0287-20121206/28773_1 /TAXON_ID=412157 /ORGANISM="Chrysochromulina rotalis, Strain UIO044" /LENGTH=76 /DNA_ID=CAMNT_0003338053 /DNA_START=159 /DNA_END=390 /DNA_ORIENTATION=+